MNYPSRISRIMANVNLPTSSMQSTNISLVSADDDQCQETRFKEVDFEIVPDSDTRY